ncbi:helix-turn-helix transcriptional regulator [Novosphingobium sp. ERN07]|uniref:helix-turn-helix domain-containing protein n=1 Tax=Novosphingobium sp. ERN07 TaxID=2726187 RepID=UPI00145644CD|nr:helix-turn-helix transcriptional regulator [Novosphingobium sp. ERN07]NLR70641.1 helix-turn-helix transcriptional regulator [Novosphingobium sp. ERN07]
MIEYAPTPLFRVETPLGRAEIVEWRWPAMFEFLRREDELMVEMSVPPTSADASACFPELDKQRRCFMGTLFTRWPGALVSGRAEAGHIRVVRCVFGPERAARLMALRPEPDLAFLQSMLSLGSETLRTLLELIRRELQNTTDCSEAAIAALMELVAVEMARVIRREAAPAISARLAPWQFRRIRERLDQPGSPPAVAELAALCGISPRHLHRQFHALTGRTVADYIETTRIEQAKALLERGAQPIKAVAQACGFSHPNSFTRAFRRTTGQTPLAFRQSSGRQATHRERITP